MIVTYLERAAIIKRRTRQPFWRRDVERRLEVAATLCGMWGG